MLQILLVNCYVNTLVTSGNYSSAGYTRTVGIAGS